MKVVIVIGEPASGKSTAVKRLMRAHAGQWQFRTPKYVPHHISMPDRLVVLGRYDDWNHQYPGTDRMSMAAQPHVLSWIRSAEQSDYASTILLEGDRLGNSSFIFSLSEMGLKPSVVKIWVPEDILAARRTAERASQNPKFWASRKTKVSKLDYLVDIRIRNISDDGAAEILANFIA